MTTAPEGEKPALTPEMISAGLGDLDAITDEIPDAWLAALRLADVMTTTAPHVTPEFYQELREHFNDTQILELGSALSVASGWQRFIEAFGIRPDNPM